ncbi:MAG: hypothetical protein ABIK65_04035 [Candidatus Eisenbacteria bacterium]
MKRMGIALGAALVIAGILALPARAGENPEKKLAVLEKIIDTSLIESKSALVYAGGVVEGFYLPGLGALFKFEFAFVEKSGMKILDNLDNMDSLKIYWREMIGLDEEGSPGNVRRREHLNKIEDELIDTMMNYGATLGSAVADDEQLVLMAFPWQEEWDVTPEPVRSLTIRARYGDLKEHAADRLSEEQMRRRITVTEQTK